MIAEAHERPDHLERRVDDGEMGHLDPDRLLRAAAVLRGVTTDRTIPDVGVAGAGRYF
jgi:hypothetical protein